MQRKKNLQSVDKLCSLSLGKLPAEMKKKRVTITIDERLHAKAVAHAKNKLFTDFAGYITQLVVADVSRFPAKSNDAAPASAPERIARLLK